MNRKCIRSYAFLDLETTGLPVFEFNKTKITEVCIVAVSKDSILNTEKNDLPRVLNKLSFCVNPCKLISPESTRITGLDNFMLENENKFDENFVKLLNHYLQQLPQPVCLVAHNGDSFDFPIIQRQLTTLNMALPDDTLCMDSLLFFRFYEDYLEQEKLDEPKPLPLDEGSMENGRKETVSANAVETKPLTADEISSVEVTSSGDSQLRNEIIGPSSSTDMLIDIVDIKDALATEDVKAKQKLNESTPSDRKTAAKKEFSARRLLAYGSNSVTPPSKRMLFTPQNGNSSIVSPSKRMRFKLTDVHERFFGRVPDNSHYAENDVLALLKCAVASKLEFIEYAAENAKLFKEIKPIGL